MVPTAVSAVDDIARDDGLAGDVRTLTALTTRGVRRALADLGFETLAEFPLANRRRADVLALNARGDFVAVEVKVTTADFLGDGKWPEYRDYCDQLYFAVPVDFPADILPDDCGLWLADGYGAELVRPAPEHRLHASRRKALTLKFARAAAARLLRETDPPTLTGR